MLELINVNKSYNTHKVLDNINLKFDTGKIYGIIGINGAGKSTLFRLIMGIYKEDSGSILLDDNDIYENPMVKKNILYIPDENPFFNVNTIAQLISYLENFYGKMDKEIFEKLKNTFTIDINAPLKSFSKGMKKQGYLFAMLCFKPKYLLLDETFEGIDPVIRVKIKKFLIEYIEDEKVSIIISSHSINELNNLCDEIIMMKGSQVLETAFDEKEELFKVQCAFTDEVNFENTDYFTILSSKKIGSVYHLKIKGGIENIENYFNAMSPIIFDMIPLTTEEIFILNAEEGNYE
ncbi:MAG: ATP-binding cassette domain-containing protein [Lachnospirales bacterium]